MTGKQINLLNQSKNHNKYVKYIVFILNTVQSFPYISHFNFSAMLCWNNSWYLRSRWGKWSTKIWCNYPRTTGPARGRAGHLVLVFGFRVCEQLHGTALLLVNKFDFRALGIVIKSNISRLPRTEWCLPESRSSWVTTTDSKHLVGIKTKTTCFMCYQWMGVPPCESIVKYTKCWRNALFVSLIHQQIYLYFFLWIISEASHNFSYHWFKLWRKGVLAINLINILSQLPNSGMKIFADVSCRSM